jgi:dienelactone hydrolase
MRPYSTANVRWLRPDPDTLFICTGGTLRLVSSPRSPRRVHVRRRRAVLGAAVVLLAVVGVLVAVVGHGPSAVPSATTRPTDLPTTPPTSPPQPPFAVGTLTLTLTEPAGPSGAVRTLPTTVRYPAMGAVGSPDQAGAVPDRSGGPYPLVIFSEGYDISPEAYATLLDAWTVAGYVVADPVYPFTAPTSPGGLIRSDIVNHPTDLTFVISSMLGDSAAAGGTLPGMIDSHEVGVIGHSDGGDVSLAAASNTCCRNSLVKAAIILSGAELAWFPGTYYSPPAVPMLAVQGTNDTMNPPSCSVQLYNQAPQPKYYLAMAGQIHTSAYTQAGQPLDVVAKVTTDFLNGYLKGSAAGINALATDGMVAGLASLTNAASVPPDDQPCPDAPTN